MLELYSGSDNQNPPPKPPSAPNKTASPKPASSQPKSKNKPFKSPFKTKPKTKRQQSSINSQSPTSSVPKPSSTPDQISNPTSKPRLAPTTNPTLNSTVPDSSVFSPEFSQYLKNYQLDHTYQNQHREKFLEIDDLSLSVGQAYEKIRKVIDWKEDNALRRGSIYRALKRCLIGQIYGVDHRAIQAEAVSERLLMELMRTGYFNNDLIGVREAENFTQILAKYVALISHNQNHSPDPKIAKKDRQAKKDLKKRMRFQTWILEIAACEIENCLAPDLKTLALTNLMIAAMTRRIKILSNPPLDPLIEKVQIELAVRRSLNADDNPALCFSIIKHRYDFWTENTPKAQQQIIDQIDTIYTQVNDDLNTKIGRKFRQITDRYDAAYRLIGDIQLDLDQKEKLDPTQIQAFWENTDSTIELFKKAYQNRRQSLKGRLIRSSIWTTLSILLANGVSIVLLEGPIAKLMGYEFNWLSIAADLLLPSLLMFLLVIIIRLPPEKNYTIVEKEIKKIIYQSTEIDTYRLKIKPKPLPRPVRWFFNIMYLFCALAALYAIYWALAFFGLPPTSVYLNIVYIAMVFFAGLAIKNKSQEITIQEKVGFGDFLLQLFSIPLAKIGSWFSNKWKEYNIVAILFSVIVDTPFSALITMISDWRNYLQERASEI